MVRRVCATRKSKEHPHVYTVKRLREKAIADGHDKTMVNKLNKSNLCSLLNIKWVGKVQTTKKKGSFLEFKGIDEWGSRKCNVKASKDHPDAFSKVELVKLALKHLSLKNANTYSKEQLCSLLKDAKVKPSPKKSPIKKPKKKSTKKVKKSPVKKDKKKKTTKKKKTPVKNPKKKATQLDEKKVVTKIPKAPKKEKPEEKIQSPKEEPKGDCISRSKLELKDHQKILVNHLRTHRGIIAAFDVGSGKTLTAVAASQCYLDDHPKGKVIVVTPKSLQENFKKELEAYGAKSNDPRYEFYTIRNFATTYERGCPHNVFLIIDEAHNLRTTIKGEVGKGKTPTKTPKKGKRKDGESVANAKIAVRCAKTVDKVLLLTATPLYNKPHDLINLAAMVKGTDPLTKTEFEKKTTKEMCEYFRDTLMYFQNPQSDEYPEKVEHTIRVIMNNDFYRKYRDVEEKRSDLWSTSNPWTFLTVVRQATNAVDPCLKCEWAVRKIMEGHKTLVYSAFLTHGVEKLQSMLDDLKVKYVEVTGSMSIEERKQAVKSYNTDKVKVMFITKAGGEGLDLKGTRNVILLEKSWNRPNEEQIIGRAVRFRSHTHLPKDEQKVDVYHLIIVKPAPEKRDSRDKKDSADEMLDALTKEKEAANANFQLLLRSVSIDAPAGAKCPPVTYKNVPLSKKKVKADKYTVMIVENRNKHLPGSFGFSDNKKLAIVRLSGKEEKDVQFIQGLNTYEIQFTARTKGAAKGAAMNIVDEIMKSSKYRAKPKGIWTGAEKNEYVYTYEKFAV